MKTTSYIILFSSLFLSVSATDAVADEADEAQKAFQAAKEAFNSDRFLEAAQLFRKAYDIKPTWKLLYNIGQAGAAAKRYGLALEAFERYIAEGGDDIPQMRQKEVHDEINRLRDIIGILDIHTHDGARITISGVYRGTAPVYGGIPVSAGVELLVKVEFEGEVFTAEAIRVLGGRTIKLTIPDSEEKIPVVDEAPEDDSKDGGEPPALGKRVAGIALIAVGSSLVAGGAATGGISLAKNGELKDHCGTGICPEGFEDTERTRNVMGITSALLLGTGTIAIVVGAVMLMISKKGNDHISVHPMIGPRMAGASMTFAF